MILRIKRTVIAIEMEKYSEYPFLIGAIFIIITVAYSLYRRKFQIGELNRFATIAILLFALPRLIFILYVFIVNDICFNSIDSFKVEITLGVMLLIVRCISELIKLLK